MTILELDLIAASGPRYIAIADAIATQVAAGRLVPGEKLPTHRDLAWKLGVTVGTVTRAYGELERRGVTVGEIGRGTFVKRAPMVIGHSGELSAGDFADSKMVAAGLVDLSLNYAAPGVEGANLPGILRTIADDPASADLLNYHSHAGLPHHRAAGADWISRGGFTPDPDRLLVTSGAQHALLAALAATTRPGDRIGVEAFTYTGLTVAAEIVGLKVEGIAMDDEGMLPEAMEQACRNGVKAVNVISTLQNPTTAIMSEGRRRAIAEIAQRYDVPLIEDDIFAFLSTDAPPPIAALAPDHVLYITSLSKSVSPGLRVGYLVTPDRYLIPAKTAVRGSCWMATPLTGEVASRWIRDGTADRVLDSHRAEAAVRLDMAERVFNGHDYRAEPGTLHVWLRLPPPWRAADFMDLARDAGVIVASQAPFVAGILGAPAAQGGPQAIRVCLGARTDRAQLHWALDRLRAVLEAGPPEATAITSISSII